MHHKIALADGRFCHPQDVVGCRQVEVKVGHQKIIDVGESR
jgi:hypothetical protein